MPIRRRLGFEMPHDGRLLEGFVEFRERAGAGEDHLRAGAEVGKAAGARAPAPLAPAALRRARVRAPSGDGRPRQRGSLHGPSACHPPADRAIHLPRRGDRGADRGRGRAPAAPARRSSSDADRAAGWACAPAKRLALDRQDIDLRRGVVHVRAGKQKRQREVPLHESTIGALGDYARQRDGTVNLRSCGRSANHISLIRHTRPGESRRRTGENRPRIAQVDSAVESKTGSPAATTPRQRSPCSSSTPATTRSR